MGQIHTRQYPDQPAIDNAQNYNFITPPAPLEMGIALKNPFSFTNNRVNRQRI